MASEAGDIGPESKGAGAATEFLLDPMSPEKLQVLLSPAAWESFVAEADLSRDQADVLYEDLKQLRELMATEDGDMPSREQLHRESFMKEFPQVKQELEERVAKLRALADDVDKVHRDCTISNVAASSAGTVSGVLTIIGLSLAPVTAGASLVLLAVGTGLGVASAVTGLSASFVEHVKNKSAEAEASRLVSAGINPGNVAMDVLANGAPKMASLATKCIQSLLGIVKNARAFRLANASPLLAAEAKVFMTGGAVSVRSSQRLQKAFGGTALAMTKGARILGAATAGFFLLVDVISLVKESKHLHEGAKTESAKQLRQQAQELEKRLQKLTQIHKTLQEGPTP